MYACPQCYALTLEIDGRRSVRVTVACAPPGGRLPPWYYETVHEVDGDIDWEDDDAACGLTYKMPGSAR